MIRRRRCSNSLCTIRDGLATSVKLLRLDFRFLDLASFRPDGRVRVDDGHKPLAELLVGQQEVYDDRTAMASAALTDNGSQLSDREKAIEFLLTFTASDEFKHIYKPVVEKASETKVNGKMIEKPKRVTWRLRRCGRVRMPYAAALLDQYTTVMSRQAFDLDFMSVGGADLEPHVAEPNMNEAADITTGTSKPGSD